jgi:hypothetical protein
MFDRLFKLKKGKYPYEFEADKGEYTITVKYDVNKNYFLQALSAVEKKIGKRVGTLDEFSVPDKVKGALNRKTDKIVKQVQKDVQQDDKSFKIISSKVENAYLKKKKDKYWLTVEIKGLYLGKI